MNWTRRLRWRVTVPVAALAALAAAALPAAAQAAGPPGPGAGPGVRAFGGIAGRTASPAAPLQAAPVPPLAGDTPAVAWTGGAFIFDYTGSDKHDYEANLTSPTQAASLSGTLVGGPGLAFSPAPLGPQVVGPFARSGDNALWWHTGGSPAWISLGGTLTSRPGATAGALSVTGGEALDLVVRGPGGAVWDREILQASVRPWRSRGGRTLAGSGPAAVNVGGTLYVLAIGTTAGVSRGWHSLGGTATSGVGAGSAPGGSTSVLVLGSSGHIWKRTGTWPNLAGWALVL